MKERRRNMTSTAQMLKALYEERARIDRAIEALSALNASFDRDELSVPDQSMHTRGAPNPSTNGRRGVGKGRGERDTTLSVPDQLRGVRERKKPKWTNEAREAARARMAAYWAARRKSDAVGTKTKGKR